MVAVALAVLAGAATGASSSIVVTNTEQLERAVASAGTGETIELTSGTYAPGHTLTLRGNVTLAGSAAAPGSRILGSNVSSSYRADLVSVQEGEKASIKNVTLSQTADDGAAASAVGSLSIANTLVAGNAGIGVVAEPGGSVRLSNSTISDNTDAGIVANGTVEVASSTITRNRTTGIDDANGGAVVLRNSIVAENGRDCAVAVAAAETSLDEDGSCGAPLHAVPSLGALAANGGPTSTRALLDGSPAIGAGSGCPGADQRGAARTRCDLGAFAYGSTPPTIVPRSPHSTTPSSKPTHGGAGSGTTAKPAGSAASKARPQPNVHGNGAIRANHALAAFLVDATNGKTRGHVAYYDRARRIRFEVIRLKKVTVRPQRHSATISGSAKIRATRQTVRFTIGISRSSAPRRLSRTTSFSIHLSNGYSRAGRLVRGTVVVTS